MPAEPGPEATVANLVLLQRRNLRDLGGLPTRKRGLAVRPGCFFRSSALSGFDPDEWRALTSLKLRSVIDLRTHAEVSQAGASFNSGHLRVEHLPLFQVARQNWISPPDQSPHATAVRYFEMLQEGRGTLAAVIAHVARPDTVPFVVSCAAGRDRTGIVVACLLELLDVTDEAIALDYAQSDTFDHQSGRAHADTIHELLALVRSRHDSMERMLAPHGVTTDGRLAFHRELLSQSL